MSAVTEETKTAYQLIVTPIPRFVIGSGWLGKPEFLKVCETMKKSIIRHVDDVALVEIVEVKKCPSA